MYFKFLSTVLLCAFFSSSAFSALQYRLIPLSVDADDRVSDFAVIDTSLKLSPVLLNQSFPSLNIQGSFYQMMALAYKFLNSKDNNVSGLSSLSLDENLENEFMEIESKLLNLYSEEQNEAYKIWSQSGNKVIGSSNLTQNFRFLSFDDFVADKLLGKVVGISFNGSPIPQVHYFLSQKGALKVLGSTINPDNANIAWNFKNGRLTIIDYPANISVELNLIVDIQIPDITFK